MGQKYMLIFWIVLIAQVLSLAQTHTSPVLFPISSGGTGHYYSLIRWNEDCSDTCLTWTEAHEYAAVQRMSSPDGRELWGHLATVSSASENTYLTNRYVHEWAHVWIGAFHYPGDINNWQWVSGEPWEYTNWFGPTMGGNEPTNRPGEEQVQILNFGMCVGGWHDYHVYFPDGQFAGPCWLTYGLLEFEQPILRCTAIETPWKDTSVYIRTIRSVLLRVTLTDILGTPVAENINDAQPLLVVETQGDPSQTVLSLPLNPSSNSVWKVVLHGKDLPSDQEIFHARVVSPDTEAFKIFGTAVFTIYNRFAPSDMRGGTLSGEVRFTMQEGTVKTEYIPVATSTELNDLEWVAVPDIPWLEPVRIIDSSADGMYISLLALTCHAEKLDKEDNHSKIHLMIGRDTVTIDVVATVQKETIQPPDTYNTLTNKRVRVTIYDLAGREIISWYDNRSMITPSRARARMKELGIRKASRKYVCKIESDRTQSSGRTSINETFLIPW